MVENPIENGKRPGKETLNIESIKDLWSRT
jgi:hypothetical protein